MDEAQFRRDLDRLVKHARATSAKPVSKLGAGAPTVHTAAR